MWAKIWFSKNKENVFDCCWHKTTFLQKHCFLMHRTKLTSTVFKWVKESQNQFLKLPAWVLFVQNQFFLFHCWVKSKSGLGTGKWPKAGACKVREQAILMRCAGFSHTRQQTIPSLSLENAVCMLNRFPPSRLIALRLVFRMKPFGKWFWLPSIKRCGSFFVVF